MGDYEKINGLTFDTVKMKSSSKARLALNKFNIEKKQYDSDKTKEFSDYLKGVDSELVGMVLKNKFEKENEEEFYEIVYAVWLNCQNEEVSSTKTVNLTFSYKMKQLDWELAEKDVGNTGLFEVGSTPLFFLSLGPYEDTDKDNSGEYYYNNNIVIYILLFFFII